MAYVKNSSTQKYVSVAADTVHPLSEQIEGRNAVDDILVLNICTDAGATVAAIAGWTEIRDASAVGIGHAILWRRATAADEVLPDLTISASQSLSVQYIVVYGCPTGSTPIGNTAYANGTSTTPTWTTITATANSTVLFLAAIDGNSRTLDSISTGQVLPVASGLANAAAGKKFYAAGGATGSVTGSINANDGWQVGTIELLDNGNGEVPIEFVNVPVEPLGITTPSTQGWRDFLTTAQVDPRNGNSIAATKSFDASANVNTTADTITITGHLIKTGTVVKANANGNTLPTGITDGAYYFVHAVDENNIKLMLQNAAITATTVNVAGSYYDDDTTPPTVDITATGTGTCQLINAPWMWQGFSSGNTISRPSGAVACNHNTYCIPIKFTSPKDMTDLRLVSFFQTQTGSVDGEFFVMLMDSTGDYKSWKIASAGKGLSLSTAVVIEPDNALDVYEYGTFDKTAVEHIVFFFKGNTDDGRMNASMQWNISTSLLIRKAVAIGGTGTLGGTWQDIYDELNLYTSATSSYSNLAPSQLRFLHLIQLGDGTNQLVMNDVAKALSFDPASDGVLRLTKYINDTGILLNLSATDSITLQNQLLASPTSFAWEHLSSHASATLVVTGEIFSGCAPILRTGDTYIGCTFTGCSQIVGKAASLPNCVIKNPSVAAGEAAVLFDANGSQTDLTVNVTGTSADYHIALGPSVTAYTLTDVTFTGTPGTDKIHVLATSGTVTITVAGTTSLVEGDIMSAGANVVLEQSPVTISVTVTTASGAPIENARVYLKEVGGAELLNTLTNVSGIVTTSYSGSVPKAVEGWVRKSSSAPYYKQFTLGGSITSSGYDATALMILDG